MESTNATTTDKQGRKHTTLDDNQSINVHTGLQYIRTNSLLRQAIKNQPTLHEMLTRKYTRQEIDKAICQVKNRKSNGTDGIPGEAYKALKDWIVHP